MTDVWYLVTGSARLIETGETKPVECLLWDFTDWNIDDLKAELTRRAQERPNPHHDNQRIDNITRLDRHPTRKQLDTTSAMEVSTLLFDPATRKISREDGADLFDRTTRRILDISGEEFLTRWDRGDYTTDDDPDVIRMETMLPFVRDVPLWEDRLT